MSGTAHMRFSRAGAQTILVRSYATSPVKLFTTRNHAGACWVYAATLGGGFVGGDAVRMTLDVGAGAHALLTTQASTKVYRSLKPASQQISAIVHEDALLAVVPDPIVCFAGADFSQDQRYDLAGRANLVVLDWITSGRHAAGERWAFSHYSSRIQIARDGKRMFYDGLTLQNETDTIAERMGRFDVWASCVITGPRVADAAAAIVDRIAQLPVHARADMIESACALAGGGALLRIAGCRVEQVSRHLKSQLHFLQPLLGDDPWTRKW
jgi:urease accessory protein